MDRVLSRIRLATELPVVDLCGAAGLGRVGHDAWLTACDEEEYPLTQRWATAIRRWAPEASGMGLDVEARQHPRGGRPVSDRVPADAIVGDVVRQLDSPLGIALMEEVLARFSVALGAR